jgi:hypothetical protein
LHHSESEGLPDASLTPASSKPVSPIADSAPALPRPSSSFSPVVETVDDDSRDDSTCASASSDSLESTPVSCDDVTVRVSNVSSTAGVPSSPPATVSTCSVPSDVSRDPTSSPLSVTSLELIDLETATFDRDVQQVFANTGWVETLPVATERGPLPDEIAATVQIQEPLSPDVHPSLVCSQDFLDHVLASDVVALHAVDGMIHEQRVCKSVFYVQILF